MTATQRENRRWLQRYFANQTRNRARRPGGAGTRYQMETLEPRVLLSAASDAAHALAAPIADGLSKIGDQIAATLANPNIDQQPIPGLLDTSSNDPKTFHTPSARDLLSINVDGHDATQGTATSGVNKSDLASVYAYVNGSGHSVEQSLEAMDLDNSGRVDVAETYQVLVVGAIKQYLSSYFDFSGTKTVADLASDFQGFLQGLDEPDVFKTDILASHQDVLDVTISPFTDSATASATSSSFFSHIHPIITINHTAHPTPLLTSSGEVVDSLQIDLGLLADADKISLPGTEFTASGSKIKVENDGAVGIRPDVNVYGKLDFAIDFSQDITPLPSSLANSGFSFDASSAMTFNIDADKSLKNLVTNVGFLGTQAPNSGSPDFDLHMEWDVSITDPSSPTHLGFDDQDASPITFRNSSSTGAIQGSSALPSSISSDVIFDLQLGQHAFTPVTVTVPTAGADPLATKVQAAIDGTSLNGFVTATVVSGELRLALPDTDSSPLGFGAEIFSGGGTLTAGSGPSDGAAIGSTSSTVIHLLLLVGGAPHIVTITTTPGDDTGSALTMSGLIADINAALPGGVTASDASGKVKLSSGSSLELTRTLTMTAVNTITYAELTGPTPIFDAEQDTPGTFSIDLPLNVRNGVDFTPSGSPKISISKDPFTFHNSDLQSDATGAKRLNLPLVLTDFDQYLDFNVIGANQIVGLIGQLQAWVKQVSDSQMLAGFDVPLAQVTLSKLLDFGAMVHDNLLLKDVNNTPADLTDDTAKLLGNINNSVIALFGTAQEFGARLNYLGLLSSTPSGTDFSSYDATSKELTFNLGLSTDFFTSSHPFTATVDLGTNLDLSPLIDISSQSKIKLTSTGHLDAVLGLKMGNAATPLSDSTTLISLDHSEQSISTGLALTGGAEVSEIQGRLSADAHFGISINGGATINVVVTKTQTADNRKKSTDPLVTGGIDDLVTDINASLDSAVAGLSSRIKAVRVGDRVQLVALDNTITSFSLSAATNDTAYTEIGFQTGPAATVAAVMKPDATHSIKYNPSGNLDISFEVTTGSGTTTTTVNLLGTNTSPNKTLSDLVLDINSLISAGSLNGKVIVSRLGTGLVFSAISKEISFLKVSVSGADASAVFPPSGAAVSAGLTLAVPTDITSIVGRLTGDATFNLKINSDLPVLVKLFKTNTTDGTNQNRSIDDLISDLNSALTTAGFGSTIAAVKAGDLRIGFQAKSNTVTSFEISSPNSVASSELGIGAGPLKAAPQLISAAYKNAPTYLGPAADASFKVTVAGGSSAVADLTVNVLAADSIANRSIFDLVSQVNRALNTAFTAAGKTNPLQVSNDGNRLVISRKDAAVTSFHTTALGSNPAIQDLKLYKVQDFPASAPAADGTTRQLDSNQADIILFTQDKTATLVSFDGATTIKDIKDAINATGKVSATFNSDNSGLKLTDLTAAAPSPTPIFRIDSVNGSKIAQKLGIFGGDVSSAVGTISTLSATVDHVIDGNAISRLASLTPSQRLFFRQIAGKGFLSADIAVDATNATNADGTSGLELSANFGFIGVTLHGSGNISGKASIDFASGVTSPSLSDLADGLNEDLDGDGNRDVFDLAKRLAFASLSFTAGSVTLDSITVDAGATIGGFTAPTGGATIPINISGVFHPFALPTGSNSPFDATLNTVVSVTNETINLPGNTFVTGDAVVYRHGAGGADIGGLKDGTVYFVVKGAGDTIKLASSLENATAVDLDGNPAPVTIELSSLGGGTAHLLKGFHPTGPTVSVDDTSSALNDLKAFENIDFSSILSVLQGIKTFLDTFGANSFLGEKLPLLGVSVNDLVDLAKRFDQAVSDIEKNPAGAIQSLAQKISETFGLPTAANLFTLDLLPGNLLKLKFDLKKAFSKPLSVDLNLDTGGLPFHLLGTAGLQVSGQLEAKLALGLDLTTPSNVYLFTDQADTSLTGSLDALSNNLTFNASLGPLGIFITGGQVNAHLDVGFQTDDTTANNKVLLADAFSGGAAHPFAPSANGSIKATLPIYFPTQSNFVDDIKFDQSVSLSGSGFSFGGAGLTVPSTITSLDFHDFDILNNLPLMIDAGDIFLSGIQDILDGQVFGFKLPIIGDKLSDGARFIENFRKQFVQPFRDIVENATDRGPALIQQVLYYALGPGGSLTVDGIGSVSIPGLHLLQDSDATPGLDVGDVQVIINTPGSDVEWKFKLGQTYSPNINLGFDLGFPGLSLAVEGGLHLDLGWSLTVGLGISKADGAFLDIARDGSNPNLGVTLDASFQDGSSLTGTLGFLQLTVKDHVPVDGETGPSGPTHFSASFGLNLKNDSDSSDTKLSFSELGNLGVDVQVGASALVDLDLVAEFSKSIIPPTIQAVLPKVNANFVLDWGHAPVTLGGNFPNLGDWLNLVEFRHVGVDIGSFLGDTIKPIIEKIQEVTGPLQPIIDIMTARIPVLSDLAGRTVTLVDIASEFGDVDAGMIYAVADIIKLINSIPDSGLGSLVLPLGDFVIMSSSDTTGSSSLFGSSAGGANLSNQNFNFGSLGGASDFAAKVGTAIGGAIPDITSALNSFSTSSPEQQQTKDTASSLFSGGFDSSGEGGFKFPIFQDPAQIFGLLLGRPAVLVTYDLPPFALNFKYEQSFPIYGPLFGLVTAGLGFKVDVAFGYDTQGIADFASGGFKNPLDLLSGFYVSDTDHPDGSGVDVPEMVLTGSIGVGAELNLGIASAGVTANIILTVNFDLYDPNHDGRVRIKELLSDFLYEFNNGSPALAPLAIFDISGDIAFQLSAFIEFLFARFDFNITPQITLFEFSIPFDREPILATERGDGSLLLNVGPNASARLNGDVRDIGEEIHVKDAGNGKVAVWSDQFHVPEGAAQVYNANKIVVDAGEGNDTIDLHLVAVPVDIKGGSGNDKLKGGSKDDKIDGGIGDDTIDGNEGKDTLTGGDGSDTIDGGAGNDIIFGDSGAISTDATTGSIRSSMGTKDGDDTITGGEGDDIIFGGGGDDVIGGDVAGTTLDGGSPGGKDVIFGDGGRIEAPGGVPDYSTTGADETYAYSKISLSDRKGGGKDTIRGHGGADIIFGGSGDDIVDGGAGNDDIFGESGFDTLSGGGDADNIYGGTEDDRIFGFRDELYAGDASDGGDHIFGQTGNDFIRGNQGNDLIYGEDGGDIIFGDYGEDTVYGQTGPDLIFGGPSRDYIEGGVGNDIIFGDDGVVAYVDFNGANLHKIIGLVGSTADVLENQSNAALDALDGDIRSSDDGNSATLDLILTEVNGSTDGNDKIIGGEGDDIVLGGADALYSGVKGDVIYGDFDPGTAPGIAPKGPIPAGQDILIGDGGRLQFFNRRREDIRTVVGGSDAEVGNDTVSGNGGNDVVFGGGAADTLYGRMDASFTNPALDEGTVSDDDIVVGDDGEIVYGAGTGIIQKIFTNISAAAMARGGIDVAFGNKGEDIIFGGIAGDTLKGDSGADGDDIIFGDNGEIDYGLDDDAVSTKITQLFTTDISEASGGADTIEGQDGSDIILGGVNNGGVDKIYGDRSTTTPTSITEDGNDIILGDNGRLEFKHGSDTDLDTLDLITSFRDALGGTDQISGNKGDDVLLGGNGGDIMYGDDATASAGASDGEDIMLGDNGDLFMIGTTGRLLVRGTAVDLITTTDTAESTGGADTMSGNAKADIVLGGVNNGTPDNLYGDRQTPTATTISNDGDDILLGDDGLLDFTFGSDTDRNTLDLIRSSEDTLGGKDIISGDKGADVAIGGTGDDEIYGDDTSFSAGASDGSDILLGDNADIFLLQAPAPLPSPIRDLKLLLGSAVVTIRTTDTVNPSASGGSDVISGNAGSDIVAGGVKGDTLYGDRSVPTVATTANEGSDIILGDNGALEWQSTGRLSEVLGIDLAANNPALVAGFATQDLNLNTLDLITTEQPNSGGRDLIYGDQGSDLVFAGTDADTIYGDDGNETGSATNNDLLMGDHGRLYPQFSTLLNFNSRNYFAIDTGNTAGGEGDRIFGEEGADVMLGEQGDDRMFGGSGDDDMTGGSNVAGAYDELTAPAVAAALNAAIASPVISTVNDLMDGGSGNDAMSGDNAIMWRRGDDLSPRFRSLSASTIYTTTGSAINANVGSAAQSDPNDAVGRDIQLVDHSFDVQATPNGRYGNDVMAGGADMDVMFGQLGNDLMQGDGLIQIGGASDAAATTRQLNVTDSGAPSTAGDLFFRAPEQSTDGDDYLEGNGGNDLMYGGLGQDDMIGGSSALFGLLTPAARPDGSDIIYGGAGTAIQRNDIGATSFNLASVDANGQIATAASGHSRDADYVMGDNANILRLTQGGASGTNATDPKDTFLNYNYDNYSVSLRIVPRAMQQLDYTLGGGDFAGGGYNSNGQATPAGGGVDNGAADLIHGESGDDVIFGMTGSDVLFGEGQDDDIVGGYGHDWISGGTGQDGVNGDDGLISTSRNGTAEPLYGLAATAQETISTPGQIQYAVINTTGELKKTIELVPFSYDASWNATDDELPDNAGGAPYADDIIFGGLGSDFLHGGSGDDAISGAEALAHAYVPVYDTNGHAVGILDLGYNAVGVPAPTNPGNVLAFNPIDVDGRHLNNRYRAGEFALYDEYDPLRKILLTATGERSITGAGSEFLLNFDQTEGVYRAGGSTPGNQNQSVTYPAVHDDGNDAIFGDLGNDWLVGGTGRDDMYGGWGNDLLNADDDQTTLGADGTTIGANDVPDTHPTYEDRAYGGAGRDVLIGNTGGDRLIDWVGEYNSYLVPYAPFGSASVSRTLQPFLPEFLYALSKADGADQTQSRDTGADALRNGEPAGEMGLVLQKDFAWQSQTGAPADPQAGNIPGGKRDVLRSADFNNGQAQGFMVEKGTWSVSSGKYQVAPATSGGDALSIFYVDSFLPNYFEVLASVSAGKPTAGAESNGYILFDYQSPADFKFAGINVATNKLEIGHRNAQGWVVDKQSAYPSALKSTTEYNMFLALNGTNATLVVNNQVTMNFTFAVRVDPYGFTHGLNDGLVGLGARNSIAQIDNVVVQQVPPQTTFAQTVDFSSGPTSLFQAPLTGSWAANSGRYDGTASGSVPAIDLTSLHIGSNSMLDLETTFKTGGEGGLIFDQYSSEDFKFVTISAATKQVILGHRTSRGWFTDASFNYSAFSASADNTVHLTLKGTTVSVSLNGQTVLSRAYNAVVTDGGFGLLSRSGLSSFDSFSIRTDDPTFGSPI